MEKRGTADVSNQYKRGCYLCVSRYLPEELKECVPVVPWIPAFAEMTEQGMPEAATRKLMRLGNVASSGVREGSAVAVPSSHGQTARKKGQVGKKGSLIIANHS